ncbi:hypothetical protein TVAG_357860 [Trichomonas vaginalis G3]|uniref:TOG domain-containing protein n=1 Tax=Trichomonas vaginalis (strain ATCC PRA-98 / G3) TaxID=412133 RepID=A2F3D3_TRIV3|nr:microtubule binding CLASP family [Trichomonas vaginalis G3]EAY00580.1 hypothetical protein TVAG_357860 [Trichomonas vaginalis G3]KAI5547885.1 microtubule binding CLASP family [Trichomonas vaginalis G3]|eukprot:XP_001313509.1 hypothetical protein [Trichomonas vaginalis G3]
MLGKSPPEAIPLQEQFDKPLEGITETKFESEMKAQAKMEQLEQDLSAKDDWTRRSTAILEAMSVLKGGIASFGIDFSNLSTGIASCVYDLRSTLVKNGSLLIAACAQILGASYITSTDVVLPALSKQLTHGTAIISDSVHLAILQIAKHVQNRKVVRAMQTLANSKSSIQREVAAEAFHLIVTNWSSTVIAKNTQDIRDSLNKLSNDASQNTRKAARAALECFSEDEATRRTSTPTVNIKSMSAPLSYVPSPPTKEKTAKTSLGKAADSTDSLISQPKTAREVNRTPTTIRKKIAKTPTVSRTKEPLDDGYRSKFSAETSFVPENSPVPGRDNIRESFDFKKDISEVMPPTTMITTKQFLRILTKIIDENNWDDINGLEMLLPPSIIAATQFMPNIADWKSFLKVFYRRFKDDFKDDTRSLIEAFHFDKWLVGLVLTTYGQDFLFEIFSDITQSTFDFYNTLLKLYPDLELSSNNIETIKKLVKNFEITDDTTYLQKFIPSEKVTPVEEKISPVLSDRSFTKSPRSPNAAKSVVNNAINAIYNGENGNQQLSEIIKLFKHNRDLIAEINKHLNDKLPSLLESDSKETVVNTLTFIINLMNESSEFFLPEALEDIISLVCTQSRTVSSRAYAALTAISVNQELLLKMVSSIPEMNGNQEGILVALQMALECFGDMESDSLLLYIDVVPSVIDFCLKSDVTAHRRTAVEIAAVFRQKVPDAFAKYFSTLSQTNQKLIELKVSKSRSSKH